MFLTKSSGFFVSPDGFLPKAELHVHLEGSIPPALLKKLATRNRLRIPETLFADDHTYNWKDFKHFLKIYDQVCQVIRTPEDYCEITYAYLQACAAVGVIYTEVMPSADHAKAVGLSYPSMIEGIVAGIEQARLLHAIEACIYVSGVRHHGVERCEQLAKTIVKHSHPLVRGFGIGGDELGFPPKLFTKTYAIVDEAGLGTTIHAGEMAGAQSVRQALDHLPVQRLGHGVRCIEDAGLVQEIVDREITLECCPGSNVAMGVYPSFAHHPFPKLYQAGVRVTLNADDPPFFATSIAKEYQLAQEQFGFSEKQLLQLTRYAIEGGFIDKKVKNSLLQRLATS